MKKYLILGLLFLVFFLGVTQEASALTYKDLYNDYLSGRGQVLGASTSWYDPSWQYRQAITIDHTKVLGGVALTNFPVLISIINPNLQNSAQATGNDILFTAGDGITKLKHEIESYNPANGNLVAWVQVPSLSPTVDTVIYIYFGNSSAQNQSNKAGVWDNNYAAVWHMGDNSSPVLDSTANSLNLAASGTLAFASSGQISSGINFPTSGDNYLETKNISSLIFTNTPLTISAWIKPTTCVAGGRIAEAGSSSALDYSFAEAANICTMRFYNGASTVTSTGKATTGVWNYVTVTRNGSNTVFYFQGVAGGSFAQNYGGSAPTAFRIGQSVPFIGAFTGTMDEVRVEKVARSAGWIQTEYANQANPATFYNLAPQEVYYNNPAQTATPAISPSGGSFNSPQTVGISDSTSGAAIFFTTDGSTPTASSTLYTEPFVISSSTTVSAIALATGLSNSSITSAAIAITTNSLPVISSFTASPASINQGQSTTLSWSVSGSPAPTLSIDNGVGTVSGSSISVSPFSTKVYTLTATNSSGSVTAQATVIVNPPLVAPSISIFNAQQYIIRPGQNSVLYWTVTGNPTPTISINNGVGVVNGSSVTVSPTQTTDYTLTASNSQGTVSASFSVLVDPSLVSSISGSYSSMSAARTYDLFYSSSSTNPQINPIIIFIHGGGWTSGDKESDLSLLGELDYLTQKGFNVYSVNYTLASSSVPSSQWPAQVQDLKCMLNYLADGNGMGNPSKISLWGYSSGAHLALMTGLTAKSQFSGNCEWQSQNYNIVSVASMAGPTDLLADYQTGDSTAQQAIPELLGYVPTANQSGAAAASPVSYVSTSSPAVLVEGGSADTTVPPSQSQELATAFSNIGVTIARLVLNGQTHSLDYQNLNGQSFPPVASFLLANGNPPPLPVISSFTASPSVIDFGSSTLLSWSVSGADTISIDNGLGTVTGTSLNLSPATTTVYTLTALNSSGAVTAQSSVTVNPAPDITPPNITFSVNDANNQSINSGSTISGNLTFNISASDPFVDGQVNSGVSLVRLDLDGATVASSNGSSLTYVLNTASLLNSSHTFSATAIDGAGNTAVSQTFQLNQIGFTADWN